ncbi:hypothetical protein ACN2W4_03790 [Serratia marcescens]|uniref:hypothetical protein n=1 Tax=Serratia marcescens TaxID=615 RepID=UPI003AFAFCE4
MSEKDTDLIYAQPESGDNLELEQDEKEKKSRTISKKISGSDLPRKSLEESISVIRPIHEIYAGSAASIDEIASAIGLGGKSNKTKYLIWSAQAYEIIIKDGEKFRLTETGRKIISPTDPEEKKEAILKAVTIPTILSKFYSDYDGKPVPDDVYFNNILETRFNIPRNRTQEAKNIILSNAEFANILMTHSNGRKTIRLEGINKKPYEPDDNKEVAVEELAYEPDSTRSNNSTNPVSLEGDNICFYITPIGDEGAVERKHSDMFLKHLVEPVFRSIGVEVVRADQISKSGLISQQIFEYIISSRFCVADLSFGNPNAFYELGVRHMTKLPTIQIIRKGDKIPFDVAQGRTIVIDVTDIYNVIDKIESAKKELLEHIRYYNESEQSRSEDNPISIYLPGLQVKLPKIT